MEDLAKDELKLLKEIFKKHKKSYFELKNKLVVDSWQWSNDPYFNLYPYQIERSVFKKGVLLKNEPKIKSNVVGYGFKDGKLVTVLMYGKKFLLSEMFRIEDKQSTILDLIYSDDSKPHTLTKVAILDTHSGRPASLLSKEIDDEESTYFKETFQYDGDLITKIQLRGFIEEDEEREIINRDYYLEYSDNHDVIEITCQENSLKSGETKRKRVYPKP